MMLSADDWQSIQILAFFIVGYSIGVVLACIAMRYWNWP